MPPSTKLLAGVELGGTRCVCILGTGPEDVRAVERLPTGEREETLRQIEAVLDRWRSQHGTPRALGIASFGPIDLRADSPTHGFITSTTKAGWRNTDVAQRLGRRSVYQWVSTLTSTAPRSPRDDGARPRGSKISRTSPSEPELVWVPSCADVRCSA